MAEGPFSPGDVEPEKVSGARCREEPARFLIPVGFVAAWVWEAWVCLAEELGSSVPKLPASDRCFEEEQEAASPAIVRKRHLIWIWREYLFRGHGDNRLSAS